MFPIMLKPREICKFIQGDSMFPVVTWENKTDDGSESEDGSRWTRLNVTGIKLNMSDRLSSPLEG